MSETRTVSYTFRHPTLGDGYFTPLIYAAVAELALADPAGEMMHFTSSHGVEIIVENLDEWE